MRTDIRQHSKVAVRTHHSFPKTLLARLPPHAFDMISNAGMLILECRRLISVVLWVLLFSFGIAASSKATNQELLLATAAYAAVLVVFIGKT